MGTQSSLDEKATSDNQSSAASSAEINSRGGCTAVSDTGSTPKFVPDCKTCLEKLTKFNLNKKCRSILVRVDVHL